MARTRASWVVVATMVLRLGPAMGADLNRTKAEDIPARVAELKRFGKPVVCNEDDKMGERAVAAVRASVANGCGYGLMLKSHNQAFPFH